MTKCCCANFFVFSIDRSVSISRLLLKKIGISLGLSLTFFFLKIRLNIPVPEQLYGKSGMLIPPRCAIFWSTTPLGEISFSDRTQFSRINLLYQSYSPCLHSSH